MRADRNRTANLRRIRWIVVPAALSLLAGSPRHAVGAASVRGTIATPVVQEGIRAAIRGTLGESVVGIARGGSTLIRSGFHRPALDTSGPAWTLGAFPNPYLDEFIDLVLVANEPLRDGSLDVRVDGVAVIPIRWPGSAHAWWLDNALTGPVAVSEIACCGTDLAGNVGCFEAGVSARVFTAGEGGRLPGADGATRVIVATDGLDADGRILLATYEDGTAQVLGPPSASLVLERDLESLLPLVSDRTRLHWTGPDGPVPSWIDPDAATLSARIEGPGAYRVDVGAPGSSTAVPSPTAARLAASPNPFFAVTGIRFDLPEPRTVSLEIYDAAGRLVARPVDAEALPAGRHDRSWDGATLARGKAPAGIYFVRLTHGDAESVTKVVRLP